MKTHVNPSGQAGRAPWFESSASRDPARAGCEPRSAASLAARTFVVLTLISAAQALDLGAPAPPLLGVSWLAEPPALSGGASAVLVAAEADQAVERAHRLREAVPGLPLTVLVFAPPEDAERLRQRLAALPAPCPIGLASDAARGWLPAHGPGDTAVLLTADGLVAWNGADEQLPALWQDLAVGALDLHRLQRIGGLRDRLHALMERPTPDDAAHKAALAEAVPLAEAWLTEDPVAPEAIELALHLAREQGDHQRFRAVLQRLPLERLPGDLAAALAWDRATDEELAWRHLDLALALARHAAAAEDRGVAAHETLARVWYALGLPERAVESQVQAMALAPDEPGVAETLTFYRDLVRSRDALLREAANPGSP